MCLTSLSARAPRRCGGELVDQPRLLAGELAGRTGPADRRGAEGRRRAADHEHAPAVPSPFPSGAASDPPDCPARSRWLPPRPAGYGRTERNEDTRPRAGL